MFKHGMVGTQTYESWRSMLGRCRQPNAGNKKYYYLKGIKVCDEWKDFRNFYKDMGERPKNYSIERIDRNKGYCKENCKWATNREQTRNRSNTIQVIWDDKVTSLREWAMEHGLDYKFVYRSIIKPKYVRFR